MRRYPAPTLSPIQSSFPESVPSLRFLHSVFREIQLQTWLPPTWASFQVLLGSLLGIYLLVGLYFPSCLAVVDQAHSPSGWVLSFSISSCLGQVRERLRAALERVTTLEEQLAGAHQQVSSPPSVYRWQLSEVQLADPLAIPCSSWNFSSLWLESGSQGWARNPFPGSGDSGLECVGSSL